MYRAVDTKLDREVAVKVLPPELVADETRRRRFVQEAKAAAAIRRRDAPARARGRPDPDDEESWRDETVAEIFDAAPARERRERAVRDPFAM